jgi:hypothetical protein
MASVQQLIDQLNGSSPGKNWTLFGGSTPIEETAPVTVPANAATGAPASTVNRGTGRYYVVIKDEGGLTRAMPITPDDPGLRKSGLVVPQSGVNDTVPDTTPDAKGRVDPAATKPNPNLFGGDLKNIQWTSGGAIIDVPQGAKTPTATGKLDKLNSTGDVIPEGTPVNPADSKTVPKQLRDNATGTVINLATDPAGTLHDVGNDVILVKPDGSYTTVTTKPDKPGTSMVPGVGLVEYDPSKPAGSRATVVQGIPAPNDPKTTTINGITYQYDPESKGWLKTDLPSQVDIGYTLNDPNSRTVKFYDKQGKLVGSADKGDDWKPPVQVQPGSAPAADTVAPKILTLNPQTGAPEWTDNQNQVKSSEATQELAKQLGVKVAAGSMSEKQAQDIITGAINTMNAQTSRINADAAKQNADTAQQTQISTAANDVLTNARGNAQTGAGMLNQRVQSATGALQNIIGSAASSKMTSVPAGVGQGLVQGLTDWTTQLGGGQAVYDTAARMVQAADPKISSDPTLANQAQQTLATMLQQYQQQTGQPHPLVQSTLAAQQSTQNNNMTAPATPATPPANSGAAMPPPITPPVSPGAPMPMISSGGIGPWANGQIPTPGTVWQNPAFVAPVTA